MMDSMMKWAGRAVALVALSASSACVAEADLVVAGNGPTGVLTTRWSIAGAFNDRLCADYYADKMELVIVDAGGSEVARAYQSCEQFEMSVELPTGSYSADATLIGYDDAPVSTTLTLQPFRIVRDTEIFVDTDFPTSSLLTVR
ncbi:hypothetical protein [Polyangium aurulentum]|uniref:hypothetical protein n=1 Tax=Polyangium aurulentum TaxID=2567896 RepID=UPI0010AEE602|nr:hypothetical protein [Polyangium aurulentum]UQA61956.1 hypothetical protein E8A73_016375 [Polyangium aurulentum]